MAIQVVSLSVLLGQWEGGSSVIATLYCACQEYVQHTKEHTSMYHGLLAYLHC